MPSHRAWMIGVVLLGSAMLARTASGGSVVVNGGFETGNFDGWTLSGNNTFTTVTDQDFSSKDSGTSYAPHSGSDYALLGSVGSVGEMSQTFATTAGDSYTFTWWLASDGDYLNQFGASWDGTSVFSQTDLPTQGYVEYSFTEVASSSSTTISFTYRDDPGYLSLDDVSVTAVSPSNVGPQGGSGDPSAVPVPGTLVLAFLGALMVAVAYKRDRRSRVS